MKSYWTARAHHERRHGTQLEVSARDYYRAVDALTVALGERRVVAQVVDEEPICRSPLPDGEAGPANDDAAHLAQSRSASATPNWLWPVLCGLSLGGLLGLLIIGR